MARSAADWTAVARSAIGPSQAEPQSIAMRRRRRGRTGRSRTQTCRECPGAGRSYPVYTTAALSLLSRQRCPAMWSLGPPPCYVGYHWDTRRCGGSRPSGASGEASATLGQRLGLPRAVLGFRFPSPGPSKSVALRGTLPVVESPRRDPLAGGSIPGGSKVSRNLCTLDPCEAVLGFRFPSQSIRTG